MSDNKVKKKEIVVINKFKDSNSVDVKKSIEKAFKMFYNLQINKNRI